MIEHKFKTGAGLAQQLNQERAFEKEQQKLKEKHHIEDENVVVVEQKSIFRFLIKILISGLKTAATIAILICATLGLLAMIYPEPREAILQVLQTIVEDGKAMLGI